MAATINHQKRRDPIILLTAVLTAVMAIGSYPSPLQACSPLPAVIQVSPLLGVEAPRNTTVLIYFPLRWQARYLKAAAQLPMHEVRVVLRAIGSSEPIEARRSDTQQGINTVVELRPHDLLQPANYEVAVTAAEKETVIGEIRVGHRIDRAAPHFLAKPRAQFLNSYATLAKRAGMTLCQIAGPEDDCESVVPQVLFAGIDAQDDQTPQAAIRLALWAQPNQGDIDYSNAPTEYLFRRLPYFPFLDFDVRHLWGSKSCDELPLAWRTPNSIRIGVRPIDLAGNRGAVWEVLLTDRDERTPTKPDAAIFGRDIKLAARKSAPVGRLAPFAEAIARAIAARRWPLAADACVLAWHSTGDVPKACRALARQPEPGCELPIGFPH